MVSISPKMRAIEDAIVLITGANRGIGAALVIAALERGARRVHATARDPATLDWLVDRFGGRIVREQLDVADPASIAACSGLVRELDILISNAGITPALSFLVSSDDDFRALAETNFLGPVGLVRAFVPALERAKGAIVYVSSIAALLPGGRAPVYHGSKAALMMMALSAAPELADRGIGTSLVYPGFVATRMTDRHDIPKARPTKVAEYILDRWQAGDDAIFPDPFANAVCRALAEAPRPGAAPDPAALARHLPKVQ